MYVCIILVPSADYIIVILICQEANKILDVAWSGLLASIQLY